MLHPHLSYPHRATSLEFHASPPPPLISFIAAVWNLAHWWTGLRTTVGSGSGVPLQSWTIHFHVLLRVSRDGHDGAVPLDISGEKLLQNRRRDVDRDACIQVGMYLRDRSFPISSGGKCCPARWEGNIFQRQGQAGDFMYVGGSVSIV